MTNKIVKKSLAEEVSNRLQQNIMTGTYRVGDKLPTEPVLMEEYGVGRSSVREAIKILENKGIVNVQQGVGTFVASKTAARDSLSKQLQSARQSDISEVRALLEVKIVEKAALNRSDEDVKLLKQILKRRNKAADDNDLLKWLEEDIAFHVRIAEAAKNPILTSLYKIFAEEQMRSSIKENYSNDISMHRMTEYHEDLLKALIEKLPNKAVIAISQMHNLEL